MTRSFSLLAVLAFLFSSLLLPLNSHAASSTEIDIGVMETLKKFK
jgi:hypothetical protein